MPTLSESRLAELLDPFLSREATAPLLTPLSTYLDLLLRWNARTNLTSIRDPEDIVTRHFGESLFAANLLRPHVAPGDTLLDYGSGAGFPGIPLQFLLPHVHVTLAESQSKKSSFLREAVRTLALTHTSVHAGRVEDLPAGVHFRVVALRAVDQPAQAFAEAAKRVAPGGYLLRLLGDPPPPSAIRLPGSTNRFVVLEPITAHP
jgi:16S rRNA (guanine527-N7)-methyltransferase